jgi:hypothetical protein
LETLEQHRTSWFILVEEIQIFSRQTNISHFPQQNGLSAFGVGCYLFTALTFTLLFLYHYRKTAGQMSTVFASKNVPVFMGTFSLFCVVQAVLLFYSKVDPNVSSSSSYLINQSRLSNQTVHSNYISY